MAATATAFSLSPKSIRIITKFRSPIDRRFLRRKPCRSARRTKRPTANDAAGVIGARGAKSLTVDASDNAQALFAKRGYVAKQRNTVTLNGEWLANTTMQKNLAESAAPGAQT